MQGSIVDVKHFAVHDGPGIRTTVFLKGCPLHCFWCHNPETQSPLPQKAFFAHKCIGCNQCAGACPRNLEPRSDWNSCTACGACAQVCSNGALRIYGRSVSVQDILPDLTVDRIFYESSHGGVTVSGGEPLVQPDFTAELLAELKKQKIHTAVDTCACAAWEAFEKVLPVTDLFLCDLKHMDPLAHRRGTGVENTLILENLQKISGSGKKMWIRIPLIAGFNDAADVVGKMADFLAPLNVAKIEILPGHDLAGSRYTALNMPDRMPQNIIPDSDTLNNTAQIFRRKGLNVTI